MAEPWERTLTEAWVMSPEICGNMASNDDIRSRKKVSNACFKIHFFKFVIVNIFYLRNGEKACRKVYRCNKTKILLVIYF